ncbi:endogenous retrovirus group K member 10 Gag polyprotein-like [Vicugna pacos]|uniref:Endogenous retrovirus group K member 10 Gag polyprotein-like n=1 Tax=Vicugna pacos TaxID=30538 RepID=A0ABM5CXX7_VICPA
MGQNHSKGLFVQMLRVMLRERGIQVSKQRLEQFLVFVEEICPWFPEQGTVNLETWKVVGVRLRDYYTANGPNKMPATILPLWQLIRDCLDPATEGEKFDTVKIENIEPSAPTYPDVKEIPSVPPAINATDGPFDSELDPADQEELEDQAARYHKDEDPWGIFFEENKTFDMSKFKDIITECVQQNLSKKEQKRPPIISSPPPSYSPQEEKASKFVVLSPLQKALQQASKEGEHIPGFSLVYPVLEDAQQQRYYETIPFKQLKELKMACAQYGPTAPFTQAIVESLGNQYLPPNDWKQVARACLSGGNYLLWKSEFYENCAVTASINQRQGIQVTLEQLTGEGQYQDIHSQLGYLPGAYPQINAAALRAWRKLPNSENKTEDLSKIRQGPDEPYQDFVARLMETIGKVIGDEQAGLVLAKQLAYENANSACQAALRPYRKKSNLADFIRICADIGPSYVQGIALAAALQVAMHVGNWGIEQINVLKGGNNHLVKIY